MAQWIRTLDIADAWEQAKDGEIGSKELAVIIAKKLEDFGLVNDDELDQIILEFKEYAEYAEEGDIDEFDSIMSSLYNWADIPLDDKWNGKKNCWVKTF